MLFISLVNSQANTRLCRTFLNVPFLNLLAALQARSGSIHIRVGGNTQENATVVDSLPGGVTVYKQPGQEVTAVESLSLNEV